MKALITGITGQDGSYLAEFLLDRGYEVHGLIRRSSTPNTRNIDHILDKITLHYGDMTDGVGLESVILDVKPDELYNLAAQAMVRVSFDTPVYTADTDALGPLRILETLQRHLPKCKFYQASSSEMFGKVLETPQTVTTRFNPQSPYGISKMFAFYATRTFRNAYGIFAVNGILFNHESSRRGEEFVSRKVVQAMRKIRKGELDVLKIGNVYSSRDFGYAKDYVKAIYKMMQQEKPDDYLIATGETHTIKEMIDWVAALNGIQLEWQGEGVDTIALDIATRKTIIETDPKHYRPLEVDLLLGDSTETRKKLDWKPETSFHKLLEIMVKEDL
jgi:GDPmannose 4,6-dehydratase